MKFLPLIVSVLLVLTTITGCRKTPEEVLPPDEMAALMADVHIGESYIENNHRDFPTDSAKQALKQSILLAHNVSQETFDTSMMWYGRHIDKYLEMYDLTIEILNRRQIDAGSIMTQQAMSIAGDSVDVWSAPTHMVISNRMPSAMLSFTLPADDNSKCGDYYKWRMKFINGDASVRWTLVAEYADSTVDILNLTTNGRGWNEISFSADSTQDLKEIRALMMPSTPLPSDLWIDSISLIRKRHTTDATPTLYNGQRRYPILY